MTGSDPPLDFFAPGNRSKGKLAHVSAMTSAKELIADGKVEQYLNDHPQSARRNQGELKDVSLLHNSGGKSGTAARELIATGNMEEYLEAHPQRCCVQKQRQNILSSLNHCSTPDDSTCHCDTLMLAYTMVC